MKVLVAVSLFTCVLLNDLLARITSNVAAPLELAVAALLNDDFLCIVASTAAEDRAAV